MSFCDIFIKKKQKTTKSAFQQNLNFWFAYILFISCCVLEKNFGLQNAYTKL